MSIVDRIRSVHPAVLAAAVVLFKAVCFFMILPLVQSRIAPHYGIGFADNYEMLGWHLSQGDGFRFTDDTSPTMMREPGYPVMLAFLFTVFGWGLTVARAANLVFGFVAAVILARLTLRITGNELAARIAPVLFLIHPGFVLAEARGGVECLFILLLLLFFVLLYRALASSRLRDYLLAGMALGLSANVRGTALLFPAFVVAYFLWWERPRPTIVSMGSRLAALAIGGTLLLSPWIVRNYLLVGELVPTASVAGVSAYSGYHICTHLTFDSKFEDVDRAAGEARAQIAREQGFRFKPDAQYYLYFYDPHDEIAVNGYLGKLVMHRYRESPALFASCAAKNVFHFWFSGRTWGITGINMVVQLPYMVLGIWGLVYGLRSDRRRLYAIPLLFILYTMAVYVPILAQARYSVHLMPFLALLAASALARWLPGGTPAEPASAPRLRAA